MHCYSNWIKSHAFSRIASHALHFCECYEVLRFGRVMKFFSYINVWVNNFLAHAPSLAPFSSSPSPSLISIYCCRFHSLIVNPFSIRTKKRRNDIIFDASFATLWTFWLFPTVITSSQGVKVLNSLGSLHSLAQSLTHDTRAHVHVFRVCERKLFYKLLFTYCSSAFFMSFLW